MAEVTRIQPKRQASINVPVAISKQLASSSPGRDDTDEESDSELSNFADGPAVHSDHALRSSSTAKMKEAIFGDERRVFKIPPLSPALPSGRAKVTRTYGYRRRTKELDAHHKSPLDPASSEESRRQCVAESPLTPLSTDTSTSTRCSPRKRISPAVTPTPQKRPKMVVEGSPSMHLRTRRKAPQVRLTPGSQPGSLSRASSKIWTPKNSLGEGEDWSLSSLKGFVWVRIDAQWKEAIGGGKFRQSSYWWPAKVLNIDQSEPSVHACLFNCPAGSTNLKVSAPSPLNILSHVTRMGQQRFTCHNFVVGILEGSGSPAQASVKRQTCWIEAVEQMQEEFAKMNDGFVASLSHLMSAPKDEPEQRSSNGRKVPTNRQLRSPSPVDPALDIPGELILARSKTVRKAWYWPARILGYTKDGLYKVEFMDSEQQDIPRSMFYAAEQDGFGTCELGKYTSEKQETENDSEDFDEIWQRILSDRRSDSAEPPNPAPAQNEFYLLPIDQQFSYVKPILQLTLASEYNPTHSSHDNFIAGGRKRADLAKSAAYSGELTSRELTQLAAHIRRWALPGVGAPPRQGLTELTTCPEAHGEEAHGEESSAKNNEVPFLASSLLIEDPGLKLVETTAEQSAIINNVDEDDGQAPTKPSSSSITIPSSSLLPNSSYLASSPSPSHSQCDNFYPPEAQEILNDIRSDIASLHDCGNMDPSSSSERHVHSIRPMGCPSYEALSLRDKQEYCDNVLLPEAILQLHLWRTGVRRSLNILSPEAEDKLHKRGEDCVKSHYWVHSVERLRRMKEPIKYPLERHELRPARSIRMRTRK